MCFDANLRPECDFLQQVEVREGPQFAWSATFTDVIGAVVSHLLEELRIMRLSVFRTLIL